MSTVMCIDIDLSIYTYIYIQQEAETTLAIISLLTRA